MLHELLVVLALAVFGTAAVAVATYSRRDRGWRYCNAAKSQVAMLEDAVNMYVIAIGSCPTTKQGLAALFAPPAELAGKAKWKGPYLDNQQPPFDPWNNLYQYEAKSDQDFRIWSVGPDGTSGTKDDISTL